MSSQANHKRKQSKLSLSDQVGDLATKKQRTEDPATRRSTERSSNSKNRGNMIHHFQTNAMRSIFSSRGAERGKFTPMIERRPKLEINIESFRASPELPSDYFARTWEKLRKAIHAVYNREKLEYSYEELYRDVENICCNKLSDELFSKLKSELKAQNEELRGTLKDASAIAYPSTSLLESKLTKSSLQGYSKEYLNKLNRMWLDYCEHLKTVRNIFTYLNQISEVERQVSSPAQKQGRSDAIWDVGLQFMRDRLMEDYMPNMKYIKLVTSCVLEEVRLDRDGNDVDASLISSVVKMYSYLDLHEEHFKIPFFEASRRYFGNESAEKMMASDVAGYLDHVEFRRADETQRCNQYLVGIDVKELQTTLTTEFVANHVGWIIDEGLKPLLRDRRYSVIKKMYYYISLSGHLERMKDVFSDYIHSTALSYVKNKDERGNMIESILDLKKDMDIVLTECLSEDENFKYSIRDSFEKAINSLQSKPAELLAKYVDSIMKSKSFHGAGGKFEELLDRVMALFRFIQGKDVFEEFYKTYLAKRLLNGRTSSIESEKIMLQKLKEECGGAFTKKLEGMFKDVEISQDIMRSFKEQKADAIESLSIDMNVFVLTVSNWPTYVPYQAKLPEDMSKLQDVFKEFYLSKHNGRRLIFQHSHGFCVAKARFKNGQKELVLSIPQFITLKAISESETGHLSFSQIQQYTGIEEKELVRTLQSLTCYKKIRLLIKSSKGSEISADDVFEINESFTHKLKKIKVNSIQVKENEKNDEDTWERIETDRQYQLDACIVRYMKNLKTASHHELISELYKQLRFQLSTEDLKKRIESLIERAYLERDDENPNIYRYLA